MVFIGACRYCGQISAEQPPGMDNQDEADAWVTEHCKCTQATLERNLRERIADAKRRVWELWGPGCERFSFDPVENEIVEALCSLVELAAAGTIRSTTIQTVDHGKASISVSTKGKPSRWRASRRGPASWRLDHGAGVQMESYAPGAGHRGGHRARSAKGPDQGFQGMEAAVDTDCPRLHHREDGWGG